MSWARVGMKCVCIKKGESGPLMRMETAKVQTQPLVSQADDVAKFTYLLTPSKLDILYEELNQ